MWQNGLNRNYHTYGERRVRFSPLNLSTRWLGLILILLVSLVCFEVLEHDLSRILLCSEKNCNKPLVSLLLEHDLCSKVRDWKAILPDNISMKNAFRGRKWLDNENHAPLPHSFTYMSRAGRGLYEISC